MTKLVLKPLDRQVIVITGASSGIGLVTAKAAAARGAKVMLVARNEANLADAVRGIRAAGGIADYAVADVGDADQVRAAAAKAVDRFGRIDTWVNNAGIAIYARLIDTPADEHEQLFRTNYFGMVNGSLAAIPHLLEKGGALITIGSIGGDVPSPILSAYTASKFAVKAYVTALRSELGDDGVPIAVTLIKPSGIDTPIARNAANHVDGEARIPAPVYDPSVVARAILDAAENVRREVTVGGLGRASVLVATHFPALLDWIGGPARAALVDGKRAPTAGDSVFTSSGIADERSGVQSGRKVSSYNAVLRHPLAGRAVALGVLGLLGGLMATRYRRD